LLQPPSPTPKTICKASVYLWSCDTSQKRHLTEDDTVTNSDFSLQQTTDASLLGAVNLGQNTELVEWEIRMVYIMSYKEEVLD
jgi:hypothetical protein